jgi:hypothetical protein
MTLSLSGPFDWGGDSKQSTPANAKNPLEWSWVITAGVPGEKYIQLELPLETGTAQITTKRIFEVKDSKGDLSSRFLRFRSR